MADQLQSNFDRVDGDDNTYHNNKKNNKKRKNCRIQ